MANEATQQGAPETAVALPSDDEFKQSAKLITNRTATSELDLKLYVGDIGVTLCGGLEAWKQYDGRERPILEKLAKEIEALGCDQWSYATLYGAARLYEQQCELGELQYNWQGLQYTHFRAVRGLPWDAQRKLLDSARDEGWHAATLIKKVAESRQAAGPKQAQPRSEAVRLLRRVANVVDDHDELAAALGSAGVAPEQVAEVVELMTALDSKFQALREQLSARKRA